jgi:hypothetical protein
LFTVAKRSQLLRHLAPHEVRVGVSVVARAAGVEALAFGAVETRRLVGLINELRTVITPVPRSIVVVVVVESTRFGAASVHFSQAFGNLIFK